MADSIGTGASNGHHFQDPHREDFAELEKRVRALEERIIGGDAALDGYSFDMRLRILEQRLDQLTGVVPFVDPLKTAI